MVIGHYAAALAAKAVEPRAPLWVYVLAAQLIDIAWAAFVILGVEKVSLDPTLPGSALVLYHMPWTHSLPAALAWSTGAGLVVRFGLQLPERAAVAVGLVVFSHWIGDLLVHRPDLALWLNGPKVGLGLWNWPVIEQAVETGLLGVAAAAWTWRCGKAGSPILPALVFLTALTGVQLAALLSPVPKDSFALGLAPLALFLVIAVGAAMTERAQFKGWRGVVGSAGSGASAA